jgi:hypothetical protein
MTGPPGFRVRVFGWSETWRVAPSQGPGGWVFRITLAPDSAPGREVPPFLNKARWTAEDLARGLRTVKDEIRRDAEAARKRAFLVDEDAGEEAPPSREG